MTTPTDRVVRGTVTAIDGPLVTIELGTDPDTGETYTLTAEIPAAPAVGAVVRVLTGAHGATVIGGGGTPGPKGDPGDPGATWFFGTADPTAALGNNGDLYYNNATGYTWARSAGEWFAIGYLHGSPGPKGDPGDPGPPGAVAPFRVAFATYADLRDGITVTP